MLQETATGAVGRDANVGVVEAIRAHHAELAAELGARTAAVLAAAEDGECADVRDRLHDWYRAELLPHIVAEEQALYSPASELDATRLLVCGMLAEHRALVGLVADLALARRPFDVAITAASARALFDVHLGKENDLLLPALDSAGVNLAAALDGMHEILGHAATSATQDCGCGCGHGEATAPPVVVQLTSVPPPADFRATTAADPTPEPDDLDVRALPHGRRHEMIFARLEGLAAGEDLVIVNDHDPKPLRYQTEAMWPGRYAWTYLQAGPQLWRLSIRRAS